MKKNLIKDLLSLEFACSTLDSSCIGYTERYLGRIGCSLAADNKDIDKAYHRFQGFSLQDSDSFILKKGVQKLYFFFKFFFKELDFCNDFLKNSLSFQRF